MANAGVFILQAYQGSGTAVESPPPVQGAPSFLPLTLSASANGGAAVVATSGLFGISLQALQLTATTLAPTTGASVFQYLDLNANAIIVPLTSGASSLLPLTVYGTAQTGFTASGRMSMLPLSLTSTLSKYAVATGNNSLFPLQLTGYATYAAVNWSVLCMHTERQAPTTFSSYKFDSFCNFNGVNYGVNSTGLYALTGLSDNGAAIVATVASGAERFESDMIKNLDRVHIGYRTNGTLKFSVVLHDNGQKYDYQLGANSSVGNPGIYERRVVLGRGLRATYYQWWLTNNNGADFDIDYVDAHPVETTRRIGGLDA